MGELTSDTQLKNGRLIRSVQIVHDDDVAGAQLGDQHFLDIGLEGMSINRAIEDEGGDHTTQDKPSDEGRRLPMPAWNTDP